MDDFFDPFDDNLEEVEKDDVPNFEKSPEIDALDDLDNIDLDLETEIKGEPKNMEPITAIPEIKEEEKIVEEKIEKVKPVEFKTQEVKPEPVTTVVKKEVKPKDEIKNIDETIARIEKRAQEVREKTAKLEAANKVNIEKKIETISEIKKDEKIVEEKIQEVKIEPVSTVIKKEEVKPVEMKATPVVEEKKTEIKKEENHDSPAEQNFEKAPTNPMKTNLQNKFDELV
jgi:hypothetical protein